MSAPVAPDRAPTGGPTENPIGNPQIPFYHSYLQRQWVPNGQQMYFSNGNLAYPTNNHYGVPHSAPQPPPPPPISHTSSVLSGLLSQPPVFQPPPGFNPVPGIFYPPTMSSGSSGSVDRSLENKTPSGTSSGENSTHSSPLLADQKPLKVRMARKTIPNSPPEEAPASTSPGMKPGEDVEKYRSRRDRNNASARVSRIRRKEREQKLQEKVDALEKELDWWKKQCQALAGMDRYLDLVSKLSTI